MEHVVLVDDGDNPIGTMEKLEAHQKGVLHRAFSILLFNSKGELLLQKRAKTKYHSAGLWSNTCCSHPLPGESMADATRRKLKQEMGIDLRPEFAYKFIYKANLDSNLTEHEYDHVFTGSFEGAPMINTEEVEEWKYCHVNLLRQDALAHPQQYTYWFRLIMDHNEFKNIKPASISI
jgi:isopentenyl-diphosphate Delta-isomerase